MIGPRREGQDWSTSFVPSTWKTHRAVTQTELHEDQAGIKPAAVLVFFYFLCLFVFTRYEGHFLSEHRQDIDCPDTLGFTRT